MIEELGSSYMDHHINIAPWHRERKHESTNRSINYRNTWKYQNYIYRLAKVETPIILSATRFAGFSTAGWLPGFPAAFFNASPTAFIAGASTSASGFVDSPTYAWGSTPLWRNRWFWINGLCCPRIATLCCFYLAVCSCLCICYEWIYSGVKQPLRLPLTIPLPMPIWISSSCRSKASSCFSRAGWFRRFCWWSSQWRKTWLSQSKKQMLSP